MFRNATNYSKVFFSSSIFWYFVQNIETTQNIDKKMLNNFFVGSRAEKHAKNPVKGSRTLLAGFLALDLTKKSFWAISYRYSVLSQYFEQNNKNWIKPCCHLNPIQNDPPPCFFLRSAKTFNILTYKFNATAWLKVIDLFRPFSNDNTVILFHTVPI